MSTVGADWEPTRSWISLLDSTSAHECKWQPWRINRFWPNKSRRERMFIRCKITQNLNTMLFVKFCCVWQKPGIPSVSNINSTPRNSRNVENLRKLISSQWDSHMIQHNSSVTFHNLPRSQGILVKCLITAILLLYNILLNNQYKPFICICTCQLVDQYLRQPPAKYH